VWPDPLRVGWAGRMPSPSLILWFVDFQVALEVCRWPGSVEKEISFLGICFLASCRFSMTLMSGCLRRSWFSVRLSVCMDKSFMGFFFAVVESVRTKSED